jgi:cysteine desulfurase/selenocysteine lyase
MGKARLALADVANAEGLSLERLRRDFPILHQQVHDRPLVYLDNAATVQKPQAVIDAISNFYAQDYANVHRGVHELSMRADSAFEGAREAIRGFINAADRREIIYVRGATEAINLVAQSFGRTHLQAGDEILITEMEHHANIVPWQLLCEQLGTVLKVAPINDAGELILEELEALIGPRTRLVAVTHVSNALGTVNPVADIVRMAHAGGARVLIDGAQAVPHMAVDVQALDCDFYVFSGHKMYGPTGIGVLYGKRELLESMAPYQGGGEMIKRVTFEAITYNDLPYKFEAGTPHIAGAVGLAAAIDYMQHIGLERIAAHEAALLAHATAALEEIPGVRIVGTAAHKAGVVSFVMGRIHAHDVGTIMDRQGVAIRAGHHCAMPVMTRFKVPATARASFAVYNTHEEIDALVQAIHKVQEVFG